MHRNAQLPSKRDLGQAKALSKRAQLLCRESDLSDGIIRIRWRFAIRAYERLDQLSIRANRYLRTAFPLGNRRFIHAEPSCQFFLAEAKALPQSGELGHEIGGFRQRIVADKIDDCGQLPQRRGSCVAFPTPDGGLTDTDLLGCLFLEQSKVESPFSEVVAYCIQ